MRLTNLNYLHTATTTLTTVGMALSTAFLGSCGDEATDNCETGESYTYLLNFIDIGQESDDNPGVIAGVNVDGVGPTEESCSHIDYIGPAPDNEEHVDNQLGPLLQLFSDPANMLPITVDVPEKIAQNIASGNLLMFMRVDHVDSLNNDSCISIETMLGTLPMGTTAPQLDSQNRPIAGQTFDFDSAIDVVSGSIRKGRLRTESTTLPLSIPFDNGTITLTMRNTQIRMDLAETSLTNGIIGGGVDVNEVIESVDVIGPALKPSAEETIPTQADLDYDATSDTCKTISLGLGFEAVEATLN